MGVVIKKTLGERVDRISKKLNIPKITVESVIREYLESLIESAEQGENIVIDNIMSIKILKEDGEILLRGRISPSLKVRLRSLKEEDTEGEGDVI